MMKYYFRDEKTGRQRVRFDDLRAEFESLRPGEQKQVGILGAGLAGLGAAWLLRMAGHDVTVIEASDRVGGRVLTLDFENGQHAEAGALWIPGNHDLVNGFINMFTLPTRSFPIRRSVLRFRGNTYPRPTHWETQWPAELLLRKEEKGIGIDGIGDLAFGNPPRIGDPREAAWPGTNPEILKYDDMTAWQYMRESLSRGAIELARVGMLDLLGDGVEQYSALNLLRDEFMRDMETDERLAAKPRASLPGGQAVDVAQGVARMDETPSEETRTLEKGNQRLPERFRDEVLKLGGRILHNQPVTGIATAGTKLRVAVSRGDALDFDRVICTVPFSVLKESVNLDGVPEVDNDKKRAIRGLKYTSVVRTFLQTRRHFWEDLGMHGSVASDEDEGYITHQTAGLQVDWGILDSYSAGDRARRNRGRSPKERAKRMKAMLVATYNLKKEGELHVVGSCSHSWDKEDSPWARGAYCWFAPGDHERYAAHVARACGRLHFAGDHTSASPGWMEGALESAVRAAQEVINA